VTAPSIFFILSFNFCHTKPIILQRIFNSALVAMLPAHLKKIRSGNYTDSKSSSINNYS
jgi:hypothetical protein